MDTNNPRQMAMFLHFSQLLGYVVPVAGWAVPLILWQVYKDKVPGLDQHGKEVANFIITMFILSIIGALTTCIGIGFIVLILVSIFGIVCPILGGIRANEGGFFRYPLTLQFIK